MDWAGAADGPGGADEAPRTPTEERLAAVWADVLGLPGPGALARTDDFFERGGDSIRALRLVALVLEEWGRRLPLRTVFDHPTLAGLAAELEASDAAGPREDDRLADMDRWLDEIEA